MKIKISNALLNCLLAALATGIIFFEYIQPPLKIFLTTCAASVVIGIILTWKKKTSTAAKIICPIIFFALGALRFHAADTLPLNDVSHFEGQNISITGTVREEPTEKFMANGLHQMRLIVDVDSVKVKGNEVSTSGAIILTSYGKEKISDAPQIGDRVRAEGNL